MSLFSLYFSSYLEIISKCSRNLSFFFIIIKHSRVLYCSCSLHTVLQFSYPADPETGVLFILVAILLCQNLNIYTLHRSTWQFRRVIRKNASFLFPASNPWFKNIAHSVV